ncbi:dephospho-CoA kinase [Phyllobacterium brassicacearum]|uniref:Dephospho-CoA kinase n=1 Tax=Phyllobacterium brassicacearum TaxID=314235 RepID=A0A2P7BBP0_9HYPH|nr:dephospho-CoA kinase [Phyllobacterium brassicacearum]PSH63832.1 dephospho-CoA kinase [Phyllobacterium brassicacearum]TDQ20102.1 dephospho-CoA kinase [Phyllobacterium brassicacearum]
MIILGLTGSIGMGKSTSAQMFVDEGIPVYSADEAVHRLYSGAAAPLIEAAFPGTTKDGKVDRTKLSAAVMGKPDKLKQLEAIIHPLVRAEENSFRDAARSRGAKLIVLDIPLLFETGAETRVDKILVVTAPADVQRKRVLDRPGMTPAKLDAILERQTPDAEKRARADFIIDTRHDFGVTREEVRKIIRLLSG